MIKSKLLNACLVLTSLVGYLEWGHGNHTFLLQAEGEVLSKLFHAPASALHPFTILPLAGQVLLVVTLFQKSPSRLLTWLGLLGLALLMILIFVIGLLTLNVKIAVSTLPFLITAVVTVRNTWARK